MSEFKTPRKRFGQNFLHDQNIIDKIVSAIAPQPHDAMIEIGPGRGALTFSILDQVERLDVIEIDRDLIQWWQEKKIGSLTIHAVDALNIDLCSLKKEKNLRIVGNLPYNISTPLLFHLFKHLDCIKDMHFMLQKEVVDRMVAGPGSKTYGRLSVMTQFYCQAHRLFSVSRHAFTPPPKVESAIVHLVPNEDNKNTDAAMLTQVVRQAFSQRRKTIRNCLKNWFTTEQLERLDINPAVRPETLDLASYIRLAAAASEQPQ